MRVVLSELITPFEDSDLFEIDEICDLIKIYIREQISWSTLSEIINFIKNQPFQGKPELQVKLNAIRSSGDVLEVHTEITIQFDNSDDLMLFKLTFGGMIK